MGTSISIPCDPCINKVFCWLEKKLGYTRNLGRNLVALETTIEELKAKRDDLTRKATREEDSGLQRLAEFQLWLNRVVNVEAKVNDLLIAREVQLQRLCLCGFCSKNLGSSYGKKVVLVLREVEELKTRVFDVVADQARTHVVDVNQLQPIIADQARTHVVNERQLQPIIVGQETMLEKAWKHLMEDRVGIMGMYGMGGVGKTTLLSQINNKFGNDRCRFDFVIWIVVSKELHVEKVQDEIAHKVGLGREEWKQIYKSQKTDHLFNFLKQKRFVLFLDDIWEKVDLAEIGVPFPTTQNKCKVAFTSRSRDVCSRMGVEDPMEVQCLADSEAFDLFQKKVGHITLGSDPGIPDLARIVAKKCSGLPLALNVIGETMSSKRTIQEWKRAIDVLNSYALQFSGMKDKILPLLKYSYDSLEGDQLKLCLLYCALYPEDYKIPKEDLIEYWICEGIIDGSEGIEKAENEGYDIIGSLVCQSLLMEEVIQNGKGIVSMHDVVREMALWIATDLGEQKEAFIVHADVGLYEIPKVKNWNVVRRMSLMENKISHIADSPECLELTTLLLQEGSLSKISCEFFKYMPKLVVLDLSGNQKLSTLPNGISNLVSLQYLNLSGTDIRHLPKGLQELRKLIHLELEDTPELHSIAGISSQQNLKVLKLYGSGIRWNFSTLDELEALEYLEILTITIYGRQGNHFLRSDRLMSCTQSLRISSSNLKSSRQAMDKLRELRILRCSISKIKMCSFLSLVTVIIKDCKYLTELTFLIFAPNLRYMSVRSSHQLVDIISKEKARQVENSRILPFSKLSYLRLHWLPELKNIYWSPLPFPCLETIEVFNCPKLKKLPFHSKSGKQGDNRLFISYGEREWIKGVEWEDGATKTRFLSSYQQTRYIPPYFPDYDDDY